MPKLSPLAQCEADIAATEKHLEALRQARNYLSAQASAGAPKQATITLTPASANDTAGATRRAWSPAQRKEAAERMKKYWATKGKARRKK